MNMMEKMSKNEENMAGFAKRTLLLNFAIDVSGSMRGLKISCANSALAHAVEIVGGFCEEQNVRLLVSVVKFSNQAEFVKRMEDYQVETFRWEPLQASGMTEMGKGFKELCKLSKNEIDGQYRLLPPIDLLISDGYSTSEESELDEALECLMGHPLHKKAIRVPIGIGGRTEDGTYSFDESVLRRFGNQDVLLTADSLEELAKAILWTSLSASQMSVTPEQVESKTLGEYLEKQKDLLGGAIGSAVMIPKAVVDEKDKIQKTFL
ncbi:MAG: VWA domain-containing protein [Lachnospiraceae bacterium]|nr:VWA domain-containing protein [Lachnospiraceae bacterium]